MIYALLSCAVGFAAMSVDSEDDLKDQIRNFKIAASEENDDRAIEVLDQFLLAVRGTEEGSVDQKRVVRDLTSVFTLKRKRDDDKLFAAVAASLSEFGEEGEKAILKGLKMKELKERPFVMAMMLSSLGPFKNPKNVEVLARYLNDENADVVRGAAESLRGYRLAEEKVRKEATKGLISGYESAVKRVSDAKRQEHVDAAEIFLNSVETPILGALTELTGESLDTPVQWRDWFDAHKDEPWKDTKPSSKGPSLIDRVGGKKKDSGK